MRRRVEKDIDDEFNPNIRRRNYSPDNKDAVTQRIIQYFEDPSESSALAQIKKLSNRAKNKSSRYRKDQNNTENDISMFKNVKTVSNKNNEPFERRKHQFATTKYVKKGNMNLMDELKSRMNEQKENKKKEEENNQNKRKRYEIKENIDVNKNKAKERDNKPERRKIKFNDQKKKELDDKKKNNISISNTKDHHSILKRNKIKLSNESSLNKDKDIKKDMKKDVKKDIKREKNKVKEEEVVVRRRKYSPENNNEITQRILQYFEDPNESSALAEIKRISNRAKKSSKNIRDGVDFSEFVNVKTINPSEPFARRRRQFATTKYVPKNDNTNLMDELKQRMNEKKEIEKKEEKKNMKEKRKVDR